MARKALVWTGGLIALYIVVFNGSKSGALLKQGGSSSVGVIEALQGR